MESPESFKRISTKLHHLGEKIKNVPDSTLAVSGVAAVLAGFAFIPGENTSDNKVASSPVPTRSPEDQKQIDNLDFRIQLLESRLFPYAEGKRQHKDIDFKNTTRKIKKVYSKYGCNWASKPDGLSISLIQIPIYVKTGNSGMRELELEYITGRKDIDVWSSAELPREVNIGSKFYGFFDGKKHRLPVREANYYQRDPSGQNPILELGFPADISIPKWPDCKK